MDQIYKIENIYDFVKPVPINWTKVNKYLQK